MQGCDNRDGERRNRNIDVVVCCEHGLPILASEVEINFGGMAVNTSSRFKAGVRLTIQLFVDWEIRFEINGVFLRQNVEGKTVIKFDALDFKERIYLEQVLREALLPRLVS